MHQSYQLHMKKIQKQYERKIKVNHNNDVFTTFQRQSHEHYSPLPQKDHSNQQNQHQHIESLKSTLKSLTPLPSMEITKQMDRMGGMGCREKYSEELDSEKYNVKLDQLTRNLQEIATKCHFSPANTKNMRTKSNANSQNQQPRPLREDNAEKSQTISRYEPFQTELFYRYSNNNSLHLPISKSHSFVKKEESNSQSKHNSQNRSIQQMERVSKQRKINADSVIWEGKSQFKSSNKKSFSKKEMINDSLIKQQQHSKNLAKIFESYDNNTIEFSKGRERSETQQKINTILMCDQIHRAKITSILIADQIYTASLDYSIMKTGEKEGDYQSEVVKSFRGGVEHIASIGGKIFGCGRDGYVRSIDGVFFHKFDSTPLTCYDGDRNGQMNVRLMSNCVKLFDIQRKETISQFNVGRHAELMNKWNKQLYIGSNNILNLVDWRSRTHLNIVYQDNTKVIDHWISDYHSKQTGYVIQGEVNMIGENFRKARVSRLPAASVFRTYDWNRSGLSILAVSQKSKSAKLLRFNDHSDGDEIDFQSQGDAIHSLATRERQLIYGSKTGELLIKSLKK